MKNEGYQFSEAAETMHAEAGEHAERETVTQAAYVPRYTRATPRRSRPFAVPARSGGTRGYRWLGGVTGDVEREW